MLRNFLRHRFDQIRQVGPRAAVQLFWNRLDRMVNSHLKCATGRVFPTGLSTWAKELPPRRIVPSLSLKWDGAHEAWLAHHFDLLGSGFKSFNLSFSDPLADLPRPWHSLFQDIAAMLPCDYRLLDWQLDFKSGYRWSALQWHRDVTYGDLKGVDIKCPWEFARLQHLPPLAGRLASAPAPECERIEHEIRAQILDFVLQNPPGFGVNWVCAMDVGIRAANIALAVDLARAAGTEYDAKFLTLVSATLRDHGRFIVRNLEWGASLCSNHYLANVVGLLFVAAWLTPDTVTHGWLAFAGREIVLQLRGQFHADGTNFEASTCYHRLSAEMMVYGAALMLYLAAQRSDETVGWWEGTVPQFHPAPAAPPASAGVSAIGIKVPFDAADVRRLRGMGLFTESLLRSDGSIPQIGDNDSGRFVRFGLGANAYADLVSHAHLPAAVRALFAESSDSDDTAEAGWLRRWVGRGVFKSPSEKKSFKKQKTFFQFPKFGIYIWRKKKFRLTIRCGSVGQNGNGGHAHCDQLSITLDIKGRGIFIDPGSGYYTPNPNLRNTLRSSLTHNTIIFPGKEQGIWLDGRWGLFKMQDRAKAKIEHVSETRAVCSHSAYENKTIRKLKITKTGFIIIDKVCIWGNKWHSQLLVNPDLKMTKTKNVVAIKDETKKNIIKLKFSSIAQVKTIAYSPYYGLIKKTKKVMWRGGLCEAIIY